MRSSPPERVVVSRYEPADNIMKMWVPGGVHLSDAARIDAFFDEVAANLDRAPIKPYALVDFTGLDLPVGLAIEYGRGVAKLKPRSIDIFRFGVADDDFTRVAIRVGVTRNSLRSNIFPDEASARAAIRAARAAAAAK